MRTKRMLSALLVLAMVLSMMPVMAFAVTPVDFTTDKSSTPWKLSSSSTIDTDRDSEYGPVTICVGQSIKLNGCITRGLGANSPGTSGDEDYVTVSVDRVYKVDGSWVKNTQDVTVTGVKSTNGQSTTVTVDGNSRSITVNVIVAEHSYEYKYNGDATCTAGGTKTGTCTRCGVTCNVVDNDHPATGHSFNKSVWEKNETHHWHAATCKHTTEKDSYAAHIWDGGVVTKDATCKEAGKKVYTCTTCGDTKEENVPINNDAHSYNTAAWTTNDTHHWHASTCGHDVKGSESAHNWIAGNITIAATCTQKGTRQYSCSVCGETKTEQDVSIDSTKHSFNESKWEKNDTHHWHAATCVHTDEKGSYASHTWDDGTVTKEATCTGTGVKTYTCTVSGCGATYTEDVDPTNHNFATAWSVDTAKGTHYHACQNANCSVRSAEAAHNYGGWTQGETQHSRTCPVCKTVESENHNWGTVTFTWADNGKSATAKHVCGTCGKEASTAATITSKEKTPATCTVKGWTTYTASAFDATDTKDVQDVALKAHSGQKVDAVAPKCEEPGVKEYWTCTVCHKNFSNAACTTEITELTAWKNGSGKVNPTGHSVGTLYKEQKSATCTEDGVKFNVNSCANGCGKYLKDASTVVTAADWTAAKLGHSLTKTNQVDAKCETDGVEEYWTCGTCKKNFADEACTSEIADLEAWKTGEGKIEMQGHTWGKAAFDGSEKHTLTCQRTGCVETTKEDHSPADAKDMIWSWRKVGGEWEVYATGKCPVCGQPEKVAAAKENIRQNSALNTTYTATVTVWGTEYSNQYTEKLLKATVTIKASKDSQNASTEQYNYLAMKNVSAPSTRDGAKFMGWYELKNDRWDRVSTRASYTFFVTRDITLAPLYAGEDPNSTEVKPDLDIQLTYEKREDGKYVAHNTLTWSLPYGYTLVEAGIYRGARTGETPVEFEKMVQVGQHLVSSVKKPDGTFVVHAIDVDVNRYQNALGYIIYKKDTNGEKITVYTNNNSCVNLLIEAY